MTSHSDISFFFRIEPDISKLTHQNGIKPAVLGNGKPYMHKTKELERLEAFYISHLKKFAPENPWSCPSGIVTIWKFLRPKSAKGKYKTTKPDVDNLIKTFHDCLTKAGFFKDDALVASTTVEKHWVAKEEPHGVVVIIHDLSDENEL